MPSATRLAAVKRETAPLRRPHAAFVCASSLFCQIWAGIRRRSLLFRYVAAICLVLPFLLTAEPQRGRPTQYDLEAVYLYQFGKFVQWPTAPPANEPFEICVMGRDPFAQALDNIIAGETIGKSPLRDERIESTDDAKQCRILYISASENERLEQILNRLGNTPVLTVSDLPGFVARGGMIQFVVLDNRVRFEINVSTAKRAGLNVSSQLLKVAAAVEGAPAAGANQ